MADADDSIELLFFDTFSHEIHEVISFLFFSLFLRSENAVQNAFCVN